MNSTITISEINELRESAQSCTQDPSFWATQAKMQVYDDIETVMKSKGMKPSDLGRAIGKSRQYVNKVLNGKSNFSIETLAMFSIAIHGQLILRIISSEDAMVHVPSTKIEAVHDVLLDRPLQPMSIGASVATRLADVPQTAIESLIRANTRSRTPDHRKRLVENALFRGTLDLPSGSAVPQDGRISYAPQRSN